MNIRPVAPGDVPELIGFIRDLAEYEREPDAVHITAAQLHTALFGSAPHLFGHVVETPTGLAGMALWFLNFSTWEGVHGIYLEDLYVRPQDRGSGAGRALLAQLASLCVERGYARLELSVLDWNEPAIGFYRRLGAVGMHEWTVQRIEGVALRELATRP